ncbi:MAG: KamA family radical SAM protein [Chlorobium sp.]
MTEHKVNPAADEQAFPNDILMTPSAVNELIMLSEGEKEAADLLHHHHPLKVSRYYLSLIDADDPDDSLRRIVFPSMLELQHLPEEENDDVHNDEAKYQPCPGIIHRYPGKVLFIPTLACPSHCRFCFRKGRKVKQLSRFEGEDALDYIARNSSIRDVIITGGDPLMLDDSKLDYYLSRLRSIEHVEIIRITTRYPIFVPSRITESFVRMLAGYRPLFVIFSFLHPRELTPEVKKGIKMMADAGLVMLQQGPLLRGINDDPELLKELYEGLAALQVIPYYAIWGIHAPGTEHFMVDGPRANDIIGAMENKTSGFCIPHLITIAEGDKVRMMGWSPEKFSAHRRATQQGGNLPGL